jgi:hypothetical protein
VPIRDSFCTAYKKRLLDLTAADAYKIALYTSAAAFDESTERYTTANEVVGPGYTAGGALLSGFASGMSDGVAWIDWTTNPSWTTSTITARGAMIYNASQDNLAVAVLDFGNDRTSADGSFTVVLPAATAEYATVRID